ncbi:MAG: hopanoid biosynthesis associated radical SAM protein HpnH, partial [Rhodospirillales bacterium]
ATAVSDTVKHPLKALAVALKGYETEKPMVEDIPLDKQRPAEYIFEDLTKGLARELQSGTGDQDRAA